MSLLRLTKYMKELKQDLKNKTFGRLTVLDWHHKDKNGHQYFLCKCSCGKECVVNQNNLKRGISNSCGCLRSQRISETHRTHGESKTRFYMIFFCMLKRCNNKNDQSYKNYGERGIKCEWNNYEEFKKDMYQSYSDHCKKYGEKDTTIDRINNNGNYSKENCRWATCKEQSNNRRSNILIRFNNKEMNIKQWSEKLGINYKTLFYRIRYKGLSLEECYNIPIN